MNAVRRGAWLLALVAAVPGIVVGLVTGYAFVIIPVVLILGVAAYGSDLAVGAALGVFSTLVLAFVFALGFSVGSSDWWFFAIYGSSGLVALLVTFKGGMVIRHLLSTRRPVVTYGERAQPQP